MWQCDQVPMWGLNKKLPLNIISRSITKHIIVHIYILHIECILHIRTSTYRAHPHTYRILHTSTLLHAWSPDPPLSCPPPDNTALSTAPHTSRTSRYTHTRWKITIIIGYVPKWLKTTHGQHKFVPSTTN